MKKLITLLFAIMVGSISYNLCYAQEYQTVGKIYRIGQNYINVSDIRFPLSPTASVILPDQSEGLLIDLKPGDQVGVKVTKMNNQLYVNKIHLLNGSTQLNTENE